MSQHENKQSSILQYNLPQYETAETSSLGFYRAVLFNYAGRDSGYKFTTNTVEYAIRFTSLVCSFTLKRLEEYDPETPLTVLLRSNVYSANLVERLHLLASPGIVPILITEKRILLLDSDLNRKLYDCEKISGRIARSIANAVKIKCLNTLDIF